MAARRRAGVKADSPASTSGTPPARVGLRLGPSKPVYVRIVGGDSARRL